MLDFALTASPARTSTWKVDSSLRTLWEGELISAGIWACDGSVRNAGAAEAAPHHQLWLQRVGSQVVEVDGCPLVADPATVVLQNPGTEYHTRSVPGAPQASTVLWVREDALLEILDRSGAPHGGGFPSLIAPLDSSAALAHHRLRILLGHDTPSPAEVEEAALQLIAHAVGAGNSRARERGAHRRRAHRELVHAVQQLLAQRFSERILVPDIARIVGSSPFHLSRIFAQEAGLSIHRYLNRVRLVAALERMAEGERDLSRVGLDVGFSSHSHFSTTFRREFGRTPSEIRSRAK